MGEGVQEPEDTSWYYYSICSSGSLFFILLCLMIYYVWFNLSFCVETSKGEVALISAIAPPRSLGRA